RTEEILSDCVRGIEEDDDRVLVDYRMALNNIRKLCNEYFPKIRPISNLVDGMLVSDNRARAEVRRELIAVLMACNSLRVKIRGGHDPMQLVRARARGIWIRKGRPRDTDE